MRRENRQKVTIEFGTDEASLERALRDLERLTQSIRNLGGGQGTGPSQPFLGGATQPPRPPNDFGPPNTASQPQGMWAPFGSNSQSPFSQVSNPFSLGGFSTITLHNVTTVYITASTVNLNGGGGGAIVGGGVAGTGAAQASQGVGDGVQSNNQGLNYTPMQGTRTSIQGLLEGAGVSPFVAATLGALGSQAMTVAPYVMPAMAYGGFGSAITANRMQYNMAADMEMRLGMQGVSGGFATPGQLLAPEIERGDAARQGFLTYSKSFGLYQALNFIGAGTLDRSNMQIDRSKRIRTELADVKDQVALYDYLAGSNYADNIMSYADARKEVGMDLEQINNLVSSNLKAFSTPSFVARNRLLSAGMVGASPAIQGALNPFSTAIAEQQLSGYMQGIASLDPTARSRAFSGGFTIDDLRAATLNNLYSGNVNSQSVAAAKGAGYSDQQIEEYTKSILGLQEQQMFASYGASISGSQASLAFSTGLGAVPASKSLLEGAGFIQTQIDSLTQQLALAPTGLEKARLSAQIAQLESAKASQKKQAQRMPFDQDLSIAASNMAEAQAFTMQSAFSGVSAYDNTGYSRAIGSAEATYSTLKDLKDSDWYKVATPEEKAQLDAQLAQAKLGITQQQRNRSFSMYSESQSAIGLSRVGLQGEAAYASMTGTPQMAYAAQSSLLRSNEDLIKIERELLERGNLSLTERNQHLATIAQLQNEIKIGSEQNLRNLYSGEMSLLGTQISGAGARGSRETVLGGSLAASGSHLASLGFVRQQINTAETELQRRINAGESGQSIEELKTQIDQLKLQETQGVMGMASYSPSPKMQLASTMNSMYLQAVTRTFSTYGDVRKGLTEGMELVGHKLQELELQKNKALAQAKPEEREAILAYYAQQAAPLFNEAIGLQQSLESGWQERLFSQVIGGGGNYDIVASQFTRRESAMFGGISNRFFGGNHATMEKFRKQAPMWYNSFAGAVGKPEGFFDTATQGMAEGQLNVGGTLNVNITLQDANGNKLVNTQEQINVNTSSLDVSFKKHKGQMP